MATLNPNLKDFWLDENENLIQVRNRLLYGGRSSSKSWELSGRLAQIGQEYKTRALCVRRFQNRIKDSVYTLIKNQIQNFDLGGYSILRNEILHRNGSEFVFFGIERNLDEIRSFEGADLLWIEEAHNLTAEQWEVLEPTIRKAGSEVWISFNPKYVSDFIWQHFIVNPPPDTLIRKINYDENPFLSDTILKVINGLKERDYELYEHVYLGEPLSDEEGVIIKKEWIKASLEYEGHTGARVVGYDVADSGEDANAICSFNGNICLNTEQWRGREDELTKSTKRVLEYARISNSEIGYDSIGVGAHVGATLNDLGYRKHYKYNAGAKVHKPKAKYNGIMNGDFFCNLKAQTWWDVADRFRNTFNHIRNGEKFKPEEMIAIHPQCDNLEQLMVELSTPKKDYDRLGRVKVESKDDLKQRNIESPNLAEAFIIAACRGLVGRTKLGKVRIEGL